MKTYISTETYFDIMKQAVHYDGEVTLEAKGVSPLRVFVDAEYAKEELSKLEKMMPWLMLRPN